MPNYHYSAIAFQTYYSGTIFVPNVVETVGQYDDLRQEIQGCGIPAGFVLLNIQLLDDPNRVARLQSALAEAINYLQTAPFNYANGVEAPGGMADEGAVKGMKAHNRLINRLQRALKS